MMIGARRLDLLKPVESGCWRETLVFVGVELAIDDEIVLVEVGVGVLVPTLEVTKGVCTLCWRVRIDQVLSVVLNIFICDGSASFPPVMMPILWDGSNVTEVPSIFDGAFD